MEGPLPTRTRPTSPARGGGDTVLIVVEVIRRFEHDKLRAVRVTIKVLCVFQAMCFSCHKVVFASHKSPLPCRERSAEGRERGPVVQSIR